MWAQHWGVASFFPLQPLTLFLGCVTLYMFGKARAIPGGPAAIGNIDLLGGLLFPGSCVPAPQPQPPLRSARPSLDLCPHFQLIKSKTYQVEDEQQGDLWLRLIPTLNSTPAARCPCSFPSSFSCQASGWCFERGRKCRCRGRATEEPEFPVFTLLSHHLSHLYCGKKILNFFASGVTSDVAFGVSRNFWRDALK